MLFKMRPRGKMRQSRRQRVLRVSRGSELCARFALRQVRQELEKVLQAREILDKECGRDLWRTAHLWVRRIAAFQPRYFHLRECELGERLQRTDGDGRERAAKVLGKLLGERSSAHVCSLLLAAGQVDQKQQVERKNPFSLGALVWLRSSNLHKNQKVNSYFLIKVYVRIRKPRSPVFKKG